MANGQFSINGLVYNITVIMYYCSEAGTIYRLLTRRLCHTRRI